ncbi:hypothetical protein Fmac_024864 [Flemingia macrophylla]|uniref:Uncharacterized protein n=1 Tax=Flemingia macrophylla TaxID=520843 RepID=A0ABD1LQP8_9FABA
MATDTSAETKKVEGKLDALMNLVIQLAVNEKHAAVARVCGIRSSNDHHTNVCHHSCRGQTLDREDGFQLLAVSVKEMMSLSLDELTTWLQIHLLKLERTCELGDSASVESEACLSCKSLWSLEEFTTWLQIHLLKLERPSSSRGQTLDREDDFQLRAVSVKEMMLLSLEEFMTWLQIHLLKLKSFGARNDAIVIREVYDVAIDTSAETRKVEGKLDGLVNLVIQLAVNQKPASIARKGVRQARCSGELGDSASCESEACLCCKSLWHTFGTRNDAIVIGGVHDVATDTSAETRKVEGKLDAFVNGVTHLAVNQKPASVARVCRNSSRGQTLDREDGFQLLAVLVQEMMSLSLEEFTTWLQIHLLKLESFSERNDVIVTRGVQDVATETSAGTRKAATAAEARHLIEKISSNSEQFRFSARNDAIVIRGVQDVATDTSAGTRKQAGVNEHPEAYAANIYRVHDVATDTSAETRKVEAKPDALVNLVTQLAVNQKPASIPRVCGIPAHHSSRGQTLDREDDFQLLVVSVQEMMPLSLDEFTTWLQIHVLKRESFGARIDAIVIGGVHDVATDTSAETRKVEGKLDALVNLVTQLVVNQKPASVARVCGISSTNDHHTNVCPAFFGATNDVIVIRGVHDVATDTSAETRKLEGKLDALVDLVTQLAQPGVNAHLEAYAANIFSMPPQQGVYDVTTDTSNETRNVEGNLDAPVNFVTQLAVNQKPTSVARQLGVNEHPEAYAANIYRDHDVATDTSVETRKVEGKIDALVNLVTKLAVSQMPASVARVCGSRSSNDHHTNVYSSSVATETTAETRKVEGKLDALLNLVTQLPVSQKPSSVARVCGFRVHDVATDTSDETRKMECKLDAIVNLVTQLGDVNARLGMKGRRWKSGLFGTKGTEEQRHFNARNDPIVIRGVHDVATDTSAETRKVEGKLDAFVNLVTQLAQPGVNEHLEAYAGNIYSRPPQQQRGVHDVATDTSAETRKVEGKLDAFVNLVTQLAVNQNPTSVARVCGVHDVATDTSVETRKVEGKIDALVNLVTQLAVNHKPASVARVCGIRSSNDHHTNGRWFPTPSSFRARNDAIVVRGVHDVAPDTSAETRNVEGKLDALVNLRRCLPTPSSFGARNDAIVFREVHDMATDISAETRKVEGNLDALVNLVIQLAVNQKPASVARVWGIHSSNDHDTNIYPSSFGARNDAIVIRGVHDVATDTSAETRKVEGKLDAFMNLVTQLAMNQKSASVATVCGIRSSNDPHTNVSHHSNKGVHDMATDISAETRKVEGNLDALVNLVTQLAVNQKPASVARHPGVNEHPEAYAANIYSWPPQQGVHDVATDTSTETRKVDGKLDAFMNLVTQLAMNQKSASVATVCGIRSSNDHYTNVCPSFARNDVVVIRGVHDVAIDISVETRKVEGKLDALVNLVTQLAQPGVNEPPEAYDANIYSRPPQQQRPDT